MEPKENPYLAPTEPETPICEQTRPHLDLVSRVRAEMPAPEQQQLLAELFRMFGDATRIRILTALQHAELCVCDLSQLMGVTVSAVSHQLRLLKTAGLVTYRREGKNVLYSLADDHVRMILECGTEHILE